MTCTQFLVGVLNYRLIKHMRLVYYKVLIAVTIHHVLLRTLQLATGGGGGDIGKRIGHGGGDGGDDDGDDDDYFDDSDDGEEEDGGLFRRRIVIQEVKFLIFSSEKKHLNPDKDWACVLITACSIAAF